MSYPIVAAVILLALFVAVTHADLETYRALIGEATR